MVRSIAALAFVCGTSLVGPFGCASAQKTVVETVRPGLPNIEPLGGNGLVDQTVRDVVANGPDSCARARAEQYGSPLRYRMPPCPEEERARALVADVVEHAHATEAREGLAIPTPWLSGRYLRWPCLGAAKRRSLTAAADAAASTKNAPLECASTQP